MSELKLKELLPKQYNNDNIDEGIVAPAVAAAATAAITAAGSGASSSNPAMQMFSLAVGITAAIGTIIGFGSALASDTGISSFSIKKWWETHKRDNKVKKIVDRLKDDKEIMDYVNDRDKAGIRKAIANKISPEEMKYLGWITRDKFKNK